MTRVQTPCPLCGGRRNKYAAFCKKCSDKNLAESRAKAQAIVDSGKCPRCGSPLKRNTAISGWWQCVAYAAPQFREPQFRDLPVCYFQCFTESHNH